MSGAEMIDWHPFAIIAGWFVIGLWVWRNDPPTQPEAVVRNGN